MTIVIVASPLSYMASLGAAIDAHARMGELFTNNASLGAYASLQTQLILCSATGDQIELAGGRRFSTDRELGGLGRPRAIYLPSFQMSKHQNWADWQAQFSEFHAWLRRQAEDGVLIGACGASIFHLAATHRFDQIMMSVHPALKQRFLRWFPQGKIAPMDRVQQGEGCISCAYDSDALGLTAKLLGQSYGHAVEKSMIMRCIAKGDENRFVVVRDPLVEQVQLMIRDQFTHNFEIGALAKRANISHQSLIRRFRKETGMTPKAFIQSVRVESAAIMLKETRQNISEISQLVGYSDIPSFRRAFVELMGKTPSQFRQAIRQKD